MSRSPSHTTSHSVSPSQSQSPPTSVAVSVTKEVTAESQSPVTETTADVCAPAPVPAGTKVTAESITNVPPVAGASPATTKSAEPASSRAPSDGIVVKCKNCTVGACRVFLERFGLVEAAIHNKGFPLIRFSIAAEAEAAMAAYNAGGFVIDGRQVTIEYAPSRPRGKSSCSSKERRASRSFPPPNAGKSHSAPRSACGRELDHDGRLRRSSPDRRRRYNRRDRGDYYEDRQRSRSRSRSPPPPAPRRRGSRYSSLSPPRRHDDRSRRDYYDARRDRSPPRRRQDDRHRERRGYSLPRDRSPRGAHYRDDSVRDFHERRDRRGGDYDGYDRRHRSPPRRDGGYPRRDDSPARRSPPRLELSFPKRSGRNDRRPRSPRSPPRRGGHRSRSPLRRDERSPDRRRHHGERR